MATVKQLRWLVWLLPGLLEAGWVKAQDSLLTGSPVRIVRSYDPHLPEWFRYSTDPIPLREESKTTSLTYVMDTMDRLPDGSLMVEPRWPQASFETRPPIEKNHRQWTLGFWPWQRGNLGWTGSGPVKVASKSWHWLASVQGAAGPWGPASGPDPRIRGFLPSFWMESAPQANGQRWSLETRLRSMQVSVDEKKSPYLHFWLKPSWEQEKENKRLEGLMTLNRVTLHGYSGGNGLGEWGFDMAHRSSIRFENLTLQGKFSYAMALWNTDEMSGNRHLGTMGFSLQQGGGLFRWKLAPTLAFLKDDLQSRWVLLPDFGVERSLGPSGLSGLLEAGVVSGIQQASLYDWTGRYPTLFRLNSYGASVNRFEGFVRWKHGLLKSWQGEHRLALGRWNNLRFFEADNREAFGVRSLHLETALRWDLNSLWTTSVGDGYRLSLQWGAQGRLDDGQSKALPGLQPSAYAGIKLKGPVGKGLKWRGDAMIYGLGSDLSSTAPLKSPWSMDLALDKNTGAAGVWSLVFRQRQGPLVFRWAEELYGGALLQLEWRKQL
jgi:hypothetical protein